MEKNYEKLAHKIYRDCIPHITENVNIHPLDVLYNLMILSKQNR